MSAPAGTGKTTLAEMIVKNHSHIVESISYTTRAPRNNEIDGIHYHFISNDEFEDKIAQGEFLEYAKVYGYYYGTSGSWVQEQLRKGCHVLLVIDTQGALQLKGKIPAVFIFLAPPCLDTLKERLTTRSTESAEEMEKRLVWAEHELQQTEYYDYLIVNDNLDTAYAILKAIIVAEEHRIKS